MTGLLIKDFQFMKKNWMVLLFLVGMGGILFASSSRYVYFFVSYCTMFGGLMMLNTISYDSFDNGYAYLFSLPVTPRLYVAEKYLFVILTSAAGCVFSGTMAAFMTDREGLMPGEHLMVCLMLWMVLLWVACLMIPLNLKFGTEKSRSILLGIWVVVVVIIGSLALHGGVNIQGQLSRSMERLGAVGDLAVTGGFTAVVLCLSMAVSTHIMNRKEY